MRSIYKDTVKFAAIFMLFFIIVFSIIWVAYVILKHSLKNLSHLYGYWYINKNNKLGQWFNPFDRIKHPDQFKCSTTQSMEYAFERLNINEIYSLETHDTIINYLSKLERSKQIVIISTKESGQKRYLYELIGFKGLFWFLKVKRKRPKSKVIYKQFYTITFRKL